MTGALVITDAGLSAVNKLSKLEYNTIVLRDGFVEFVKDGVVIAAAKADIQVGSKTASSYNLAISGVSGEIALHLSITSNGKPYEHHS
jgi:hypothetical protein